MKGGQIIDVQIDFADGTLPIEHQVLVRTLNRFLALHPDNEDGEAAVRLAMELLELADVAPQKEIVQAVGYAQSRSLRTYQQRLQEQGLGGLFDQPIPGRPAVTSQPTVERAVVQAVLAAVITEHALQRRSGRDRSPLPWWRPSACGWESNGQPWLSSYRLLCPRLRQRRIRCAWDEPGPAAPSSWPSC